MPQVLSVATVSCSPDTPLTLAIWLLVLFPGPAQGRSSPAAAHVRVPVLLTGSTPRVSLAPALLIKRISCVDAGAEHRPAGVSGAGQVHLEQPDVAAVVQQDCPDGAAFAVDPHVFVVRPQVEVLGVQPAGLGGPRAAGLRGLEQHP